MGNRLSKIYTRTGDDGSTGLGDGSRVSKDSARVTAYGTVDEANSAIGLVLACEIARRTCATLLVAVQHQMFDLGGELCIPGHAAIFDADIERLESQLDGFNADLPPLKDFILPGGGDGRGPLPSGAHHLSARRTRSGDAVPPRCGAPGGDPLPQSPVRPAVRARAGAGARQRARRGALEPRPPHGAADAAVYTHPDCLLHDPGPGHAECSGAAERRHGCAAPGPAASCAGARRRWPPAASWPRVHARELVAMVLDTRDDHAAAAGSGHRAVARTPRSRAARRRRRHRRG